MKICILMGSPRKKGNTAALLSPFCDELQHRGHAKKALIYGKPASGDIAGTPGRPFLGCWRSMTRETGPRLWIREKNGG